MIHKDAFTLGLNIKSEDYVLKLEEYRLPNRVYGTVAIAKPNQYINVSLCHSGQGGYSDDTNRY
ncbi:MAG: hypothetical protein RH949_08115 [Coleofasciculus sp. A1-SPW-01]|uniref:hypothetical protein n=1 Tax=Coleofasciculus sp. A1-SPW-01 TaxID=3070819 RepID=UPI0032FD9FA6